MARRLSIYRLSMVREQSVAVRAPVVHNPRDAAEVLREILGDRDRETFCVLFLDTRHHVIGAHISAIGTLDRAPVTPRETFRAAIVAGAAAIVCGHNHPSGDPTPSKTDLMLTVRLSRAADVIGIKLLDHVIVGAGGSCVSLAERGALPRDAGQWQP